MPASSYIALAAEHPLELDAERLEARWAARGIETRLVSAPYIDYLYNGERFADLNERLDQSDLVANSDLAPTCFRYSTIIWLAKLFPSLTNWRPDWPASTGKELAGSVVLLLGAAALSFAIRRFGLLRLGIFMALAAFIGMVLETLLLLLYQTQKGALYRDLGLLLMSFMFGLAAGAGTFGRLFPTRQDVGRRWGLLLSAGR